MPFCVSVCGLVSKTVAVAVSVALSNCDSVFGISKKLLQCVVVSHLNN